jgi:PAS domain S-box-containing protein
LEQLEQLERLADPPNEASFALLFDAVPVGLLVVDADGCIRQVNRAACALFGHEASELVGASVESLAPEAAREHHARRREEITKRNAKVPLPPDQLRAVVRRDGTELTVEMSLSPLGGGTMLMLVRDATARVRREREAESRAATLQRELAALLDRYQALAHGLPDRSLLLFDRDLRILVADGLGLARAGLEGAVGKTVWGAFLKVAKQVEPLCRAALAGDSRGADLAWNGGSFRVEAVPATREGAVVVAGALLVRDVSSAVATAAALEASEERYRNLFDACGEAMAVIALDGPDIGTVLAANRRAAAMHGVDVATLVGSASREFIPADGRAQSAERLQRAARGGELPDFETTHVRADGTRFPIRVHVTPLEFAGRRALLAVWQDLTEAKRAAEALREAIEAAHAASRAKSAFLANMSHELRTPMNAILGYAQLIARDPRLHPTHAEHLAIVQRSGEHLLALLNDVLEMSKIEAGHRTLARDFVDVFALLDDLTHLFRLQADAKGLAFAIERSPSVPRYVVTDEGKLRQVLVNLLGNAVKFTPAGGITLRVSVADAADARDATLRVEVADTGEGIAAEELATLFKPFVQTRAGAARGGGTGLGLALSREIARLMGGDLTATSQTGRGSVFRFDFPLEAARADGPPPSVSILAAPASERVVGLLDPARVVRVLVVDDSPEDRALARRILEAVGFQVSEACEGAAALVAVDQWHPHLVMLDMRMPVLDGYATARAIRARAGGATTAILAVTASALDVEREAIFEATADGLLCKPYRDDALLREVSRLLGVQYRFADAVPPAVPRDAAVSRAPSASASLDVPVETARALREAARLADYERLNELIASLAEHRAEAAEALGRMAREFAYEAIEAALA